MRLPPYDSQVVEINEYKFNSLSDFKTADI